MTGITPADLKKLAKKKGVKKLTRITSKEYNEILQGKQGKGTSSKGKKEHKTFSFTYHVQICVRDKMEGYKITLIGRHYSNNDTNSFSRLEIIRYNKAIHKASEEFALLNRDFIKRLKAFQKASVEYIFHNPRSRDYDNNAETIKHFQDTFSILGFIIDDKREFLSHPKEVGECLGKEYKAEALIFPI